MQKSLSILFFCTGKVYFYFIGEYFQSLFLFLDYSSVLQSFFLFNSSMLQKYISIPFLYLAKVTFYSSVLQESLSIQFFYTAKVYFYSNLVHCQISLYSILLWIAKVSVFIFFCTAKVYFKVSFYPILFCITKFFFILILLYWEILFLFLYCVLTKCLSILLFCA